MKTTANNRRIAYALVLPAATLVLLAGGCTEVATSEQRLLAAEPVTNVTFGSMTQPVRDYDRTAANYQNGDIASNSTAFRYKSSDRVHPVLVPAAEVGVFVANMVTGPVTAYEQRDGIVSTGPQLASTHTAMPPLPDSPAQFEHVVLTEPSTQPSEKEITLSAGEPLIVSTSAGLTPAAELSTSAFAIVGHVQFPGRYESQKSLTLTQAILAAGLIEADGNKVLVKIERTGEEPSSALLSEILAGETANPELAPGDVVTVTVKP